MAEYSNGAVSSAGEHVVHTDGVAGSIPAPPTTFSDTTTHRGDVAELLVAAELLRRGYRVSRPLSNGTPYDLIVDDGKSLIKVQVKRAYGGNGAIRASLSTSKYHRGRKRVSYAGQCDVVVVADCEAARFYALKGSDLSFGEVRLRVVPTKNNQAHGVRIAEDYEMGRIFPPLSAPL